MVVNAAFASAFLVRRSRRNSLLLAAVAASFVLQTARWMSVAQVPADHTAVLVQENIPVLDNGDWTRQYLQDTLADLLKISQQLPSGERVSRPDLIVWPESPAPFYSSDAVFRGALTKLAQDTHAWIVAGNISVQNSGSPGPGSNQVFNSASLVSPNGDWTARYDKVHLVPFGEYVPFKQVFSFAGGLTKEVGDFTRGTSRAPLAAGSERLGVFICYESIFPDEVRQFAAAGAQVFINVSDDGWYGRYGAPGQHLNMARMRAIENRRWVLRATNSGITASIDPLGRVVEQSPPFARNTLAAPYDFASVTTFYTLHGDWFAWACVIISLAGLFVRFRFQAGSISS